MLEILLKKYKEEFPWFELSPDSNLAKSLLERLFIEITPTHPLYEETKRLKAVAKNGRNDDAIYFDGDMYYLIHLTWTSGSKDYPRYRIIRPQEIIAFLENDFLLE